MGAGLYDVVAIRFGLVQGTSTPIWRPSAEAPQWAALLGPDADGWVFTGEIGRWTTEATAIDPVVWPDSAASPHGFIPAGVTTEHLAEYQVLLAPRRGSFVALGMRPDGTQLLWAVVGSHTTCTQELGEGSPQWHESVAGFSGALAMTGARSATAVHWAEDSWHITTVKAPGTVIGALMLRPANFLVSTLEEDGTDPCTIGSSPTARRPPECRALCR